jgi:uncharacterized protein with GYD domain
MIKARYTADGSKGLLEEGGTKRRTAVAQACKSAGIKLESFYFALGVDDAFVVVDAPDHATVAAMALAVSGTGAVEMETVVLLTPEELDEAAKKTVKYRAPGH